MPRDRDRVRKPLHVERALAEREPAGERQHDGGDALLGCAGETVPYAGGKAGKAGAPLSPDHTHFVLVDTGVKGKFGGSNGTRTGLETLASGSFRAPIVPTEGATLDGVHEQLLGDIRGIFDDFRQALGVKRTIRFE